MLRRPPRSPLFPSTPLFRSYAAIADPTRRAILAALAGGERNVGSLAGRFPISFNGVSKHVKVLERDRKSTRLNSSHLVISYAVFCLKKKKNCIHQPEIITDI